jgi:hypothetical protein
MWWYDSCVHSSFRVQHVSVRFSGPVVACFAYFADLAVLVAAGAVQAGHGGS